MPDKAIKPDPNEMDDSTLYCTKLIETTAPELPIRDPYTDAFDIKEN